MTDEAVKNPTAQADSNDPIAWIISAPAGDEATPDQDQPLSGNIVLEGSLGIAEVEALHQRMTRILQANVDITISTEQLSRVDAAGAQLLYAFVREVRQRGLPLKWTSVSDALLEALNALGLNDHMGIEAQ
ncbi:STAS domain-containing protein [Mariprofundus erugo]|uniref:STAS domain-containing protein n=1 Tax=Mariprofundus erugo TaxID=2528639 RepID=A0A5R9GPG4_9PROT|nr:STAS domain-containing protein [Mariprofundus erugo]TLS66293.1 STAS domain-containing protein [Mariprofundus erugo]